MWRIRCFAENLKAILTGVPGSCDPTFFAKNLVPLDMEVWEGGGKVEKLAGCWSLERQGCEAITEILNYGRYVGVSIHPGEIVLDITGIHDDEIDGRFKSVDDQVINNPALLVAHQSVLGLSNNELGHVICQ